MDIGLCATGKGHRQAGSRWIVKGRDGVRKNSYTAFIFGAVFLTLAVASPAFGGNVSSAEQDLQGIRPGKGVPLTDVQLDAVTAGESPLCTLDTQADECTSTRRNRFTDVIFWDEWVRKRSHQASGAVPGGFVQANTTGTLQINSTGGR